MSTDQDGYGGVPEWRLDSTVIILFTLSRTIGRDCTRIREVLTHNHHVFNKIDTTCEQVNLGIGGVPGWCVDPACGYQASSSCFPCVTNITSNIHQNTAT